MTSNSVSIDHTVGLGIPSVDHARKSWSFIILHLGFLWLQKLSSLEIDRISIFLCYVPIFSRPSLPLLLCTFSNNRSNVNFHKIDAQQRHFLDKGCERSTRCSSHFFYSIWFRNGFREWTSINKIFLRLTLSKASWILGRKLKASTKVSPVFSPTEQIIMFRKDLKDCVMCLYPKFIAPSEVEL